jgi:hypothetical protein
LVKTELCSFSTDLVEIYGKHNIFLLQKYSCRQNLYQTLDLAGHEGPGLGVRWVGGVTVVFIFFLLMDGWLDEMLFLFFFSSWETIFLIASGSVMDVPLMILLRQLLVLILKFCF